MAKLRASSRLVRSAEGEERSIGGSALPTHAPAGAGRRRVVGAAAMVALIAAIAGGVALRGSTPGADRRAPADAAQSPPGADVRASAAAPLALTAETAAQLTATVEVPAEALVRVNGEARAVAGGRLDLRGHAGDVFEVEVAHEGAKKTAKVILTSDGKAEPARIELDPAPGARPRGPRGGPGARGTPTSTAQAPTPGEPPTSTTVKPVEHW
jgi:hypothetical protein